MGDIDAIGQQPLFYIRVGGGLQAADHRVVNRDRRQVSVLGHFDMHGQRQAGDPGLGGGILIGVGVGPSVGAVNPCDKVVQLHALVGNGLAGRSEVQVIAQHVFTADQHASVAL